ncbi:helix-turn-helix domain-containing protein [Ferrimicrobium sp.]|jgi:hypothetical protein|uniref:AlbA family DNA-binding domain-containing protein n=1 Tax=Ferrimicrobium sp. TaxID=2926050 RepID=UPI002619BEEA|nr:ATP-binding protein [Ferrimicrobium sp.]
MDEGNLELSAVGSMLSCDERNAWVKLLLGPPQDGIRPVWSTLAIVGPRPEQWDPYRWEYKQCSFIAVEMKASDLANHIDGGIHDLELDTERTRFNFNASSIQWMRHASREQYDNVELPWPSVTYNLSFDGQSQSLPNGYLCSMDAPSFPSFTTAFFAFFYDRHVSTGQGYRPTLGQFSLVVAEEECRIARVVVGVASLDVWVEGSKIADTLLELNSAQDRETLVVHGPDHYTFSLPNGLSQDAWVWLKGERGYLDYRYLSGWGGGHSADVEFAVPEDPVAELSALAAQGESTRLEYKRELPTDLKDSKRKIFKTVVAFANGEGGTLLFGVDGDDNTGSIVGLTGDASVLQRKVNDLIRALVMPGPPCTITAHEIDGKCVLRVDVEANQGLIYALTLDQNRPEYYVRRNGSTYCARPEELTSLVKHGVPPIPFAITPLN